jgi:NADH-quinone oxidoreductase subunit A
VPPETLYEQFTTVLMFLLFGAGFVVLNMVAIGRLIRARTKYTEQKSTTYECGEPTFGSAFIRFDIRFYVLALVFVIFDVEVLFLFPWAVVLKPLGMLALVEAAIFVAILALGLAYVWRKGDVDWIPKVLASQGAKAVEPPSAPAPPASPEGLASTAEVGVR